MRAMSGSIAILALFLGGPLSSCGSDIQTKVMCSSDNDCFSRDGGGAAGTLFNDVDVDAIINGTEGPVVDGRPYHTEEFTQTLEAYHQQVMVAHRGRDRSMPLPVPAPAAEEAEPISAWKRQATDPGAEL